MCIFWGKIMQKHICVGLVVAAVVLCSVSAQRVPPVPCPRYFRYVNNHAGDIEGQITLPYSNERSIALTVNASMRGFYGKDKLKMELNLLTSLNDLVQQKTSKVQYSLSFPVQQSIPQLTSMVLNGQEYCAGPPVVPESQGSLQTSLQISRFHQLTYKRKRGTGLLDEDHIPEEGNDYFYPAGYAQYQDYSMSGSDEGLRNYDFSASVDQEEKEYKNLEV